MKRLLLASLLLTGVLGGGVAVGCGGGSDTALDVDNGFESDDPSGRQATQGGDSAGAADAAAAPSGGAEADDPRAPERAIEEADILKVDGNRLYALSRYGGLAVVDVSDPDHMKLLGRKRTDGIPFEMYVRDGRAHVMFNEFGRWVRSEGSPYGRWEQTSEIQSFDVTNPAAIAEVAHFDVPGSVADSRLVGDVLYLVTYENGYCWGCNERPGTIVTSFHVGGAITKVDQLAYTAPDKSYSGWQRSVSATNQRLYIAGPEWGWAPGQPQNQSVIQVVDIADPTGRLVKGADVAVAGQINSRWQMDEHAGVLRVVSQYNNGGGGTINPKVQTFTVQSASQLLPLGQTELVLPKPESLRNVRFDGARAYAITAERTDPLFTIDLSDPAAPKQAGELEMPGWVMHMEPRGDRLVGFGFEDTTWSSRLAVSLFDVSDLTKPALLKRVAFGSAGGNYAEDQDRVHKSVRILDDQGLILVPFASRGGWRDGEGCSKGQSGIQLVDLTRDDLVLRGVAPQYGMPRRALTVNGRLLAISDRNVTSFDITSRDAPAKKNELDLSNPAFRMTELPGHVASITNDWWSSEVLLSLTPKDRADDAQTTGKVSLAPLADPNPAYCSGNAKSAWTAWYAARLFANGNHVYVAVPVHTYDPAGAHGGKLVVGAVDASDPAHPKLVGKTEAHFTQRERRYGWGWGGFWDGHALYSAMNGMGSAFVGAGDAVVQLGSKLAYLELDRELIEEKDHDGKNRYRTEIHRKIHVVDLADPTAPAVSAPVELPYSLGAGPLHVMNGTVLTSRWVPSPSGNGKVRFFVDRVDVSGPQPARLPSINTPGSLLSTDEASSRYVTVDYSAERTKASDWRSCTGGAYVANVVYDHETKDCMKITRSFKLADVSGTRVRLRDTLLPPAQNIAGVRASEDRVFVTRFKRYDYSQPVESEGYYTEPPVLEQGGLWAIGGIRDGKLAIVSEMVGDAEWPLAARGSKVALYTEGGLAIYDTATPSPTLLTEQRLRGWGYSSHVLMSDHRAICSLGDWGLQTITY